MATNKEKQFLDNYDIERFERPSVATDMVIFSILEEVASSSRKMSEGKLSILLIKRKDYPYKDCWALPGGFLRKTETVEECAMRELGEETGLKTARLLPIGSFSEPGRDPRGWIVSSAFMAPVYRSKTRIKGGSDALEAAWFTVDVDYDDITSCWHLEMTSQKRSQETKTCADVVQKKNPYGMTVYEIKKSDNIAFDHPKIIISALVALRKHIASDGLAYEFLDNKFTFNQLQKVHEIVLNESLLSPNFRRKTMEEIEETGEMLEGKAFRPAMLYRKKK